MQCVRPTLAAALAAGWLSGCAARAAAGDGRSIADLAAGNLGSARSHLGEQVRWPAPIRLTVAFEGLSDDERSWSLDAFRYWGETGIPLQVRVTERPDEANVVFRRAPARRGGRAVRHPGRPSRPEPPGRTRLVRAGRRILRARVELRLLGADGKVMLPGRRKAVILHETGHVLGLGHTGIRTSIMYPVLGLQPIHPADSAALRRLYDPARGRTVLGEGRRHDGDPRDGRSGPRPHRRLP